MNKTLTNRDKIILYIAGIVFFGMGIVFMFYPIFIKNRMLNNEIKNSRLKIEKYLMLLKKEKHIQAKYSKFNLGLFPASQKQQGQFVSVLCLELEKIAKNANIQLIDIRPRTFQESAKSKEITIDLKLEATMEGYIKFIYDIENSLMLRIKGFQLNAKSNSQILEGSFSISANSG